jgi:TRAP-type C4-dicarboxylate transport system substrate-binding protein
MTREFVESQVDQRVEFLASKGMTVYTPTAAEMAQFKELGSPSYVDWLKARIDQQWIDQALEEAAKANAEAK